ncbi:MAG: hypothetical protein EOP84_12155 [Verrucomicrobiaceae bacterium]|nr:MAG: hypothetical protein EOP84_12155 [Verrucomicrobiaceae bacterium]
MARTDYEKREALKKYYALLYARMEKMDKSLKKEIEVREPLTVRRLHQTRIAPTEPPIREVRVREVREVRQVREVQAPRSTVRTARTTTRQ